MSAQVIYTWKVRLPGGNLATLGTSVPPFHIRDGVVVFREALAMPGKVFRRRTAITKNTRGTEAPQVAVGYCVW